ncbi:MAG: hypothetical protein GY793_10310 [Proteobacteria bacterium]|nr:hypothetical protein [Pseudomonadota bacterium]
MAPRKKAKKRKKTVTKRKAPVRKRVARALAPVKRKTRRAGKKTKRLARKMVGYARKTNQKHDVKTLVSSVLGMVVILATLAKVRTILQSKNKWIMAGVPFVAGLGIYFTKFSKKNAWAKQISTMLMASGVFVAISQIKQVQQFLYGPGGVERQTLAGYAEDIDLSDSEQMQLLGEEVYEEAYNMQGDEDEEIPGFGDERYEDSELIPAGVGYEYPSDEEDTDIII